MLKIFKVLSWSRVDDCFCCNWPGRSVSQGIEALLYLKPSSDWSEDQIRLRLRCWELFYGVAEGQCWGSSEQDDPGQDMSYWAPEPQLVIIEFYCQFSWATGRQDVKTIVGMKWNDISNISNEWNDWELTLADKTTFKYFSMRIYELLMKVVTNSPEYVKMYCVKSGLNSLHSAQLDTVAVPKLVAI